MKTVIFTLFVLASSVNFTLSLTRNYDGSQLLRIEPPGQTSEPASYLEKLSHLESHFEADFWLEPSTTRPVDICVAPHHVYGVKAYLQENGIPFTVSIKNVGELIREQNEEVRRRQDGEMNWFTYQRYDVISSYVDQLAADYPNLVNLTVYGVSTEGRPLKVVKIGTDTGANNKISFWLDGGIHAREWISPAIVTWFMRELLTNPAYQDVLDSVDIYIVPSANPDGYEYTHTTNRLWRKTRSDRGSPTCRGVDPNRNFPYKWAGLGTSPDPCSDIFHGPQPLSEPETAGIVEFIQAKAEEGTQWVSYFAMHSYAQMWLVPWGWTFDLPDTYEELIEFGMVGAEALEAVHGTVFQVGSVTELLSPGAGGSDDWAYGSGIFRYSQTVEVRDTGRYGFLLPPDQIIPTAEETFQAIVAVARFAANKYREY